MQRIPHLRISLQAEGSGGELPPPCLWRKAGDLHRERELTGRAGHRWGYRCAESVSKGASESSLHLSANLDQRDPRSPPFPQLSFTETVALHASAQARAFARGSSRGPGKLLLPAWTGDFLFSKWTLRRGRDFCPVLSQGAKIHQM